MVLQVAEFSLSAQGREGGSALAMLKPEAEQTAGHE
jgi:hypothetical protein